MLGEHSCMKPGDGHGLLLVRLQTQVRVSVLQHLLRCGVLLFVSLLGLQREGGGSRAALTGAVSQIKDPRDGWERRRGPTGSLRRSTADARAGVEGCSVPRLRIPAALCRAQAAQPVPSHVGPPLER